MQSIKVSSFKFQLDKENIKVSFISQENINDNNSVARTQSLKMLQLLELVYMGTQREDETENAIEVVVRGVSSWRVSYLIYGFRLEE
ncbi:hypothetical protein YC2023_011814 [Brassica napus]